MNDYPMNDYPKWTEGNTVVGKELVMRRVEPVTATPVPDRATRVASWIGWHLFELAGVTAPAVVAVTVSPWAWLVSGVVGGGWGVHEVRVAREQAAIRAGRDLPATLDPPTESAPTTESVAGERAGGVR
jgi:hypothetical protein